MTRYLIAAIFAAICGVLLAATAQAAYTGQIISWPGDDQTEVMVYVVEKGDRFWLIHKRLERLYYPVFNAKERRTQGALFELRVHYLNPLVDLAHLRERQELYLPIPMGIRAALDHWQQKAESLAGTAERAAEAVDNSESARKELEQANDLLTVLCVTLAILLAAVLCVVVAWAWRRRPATNADNVGPDERSATIGDGVVVPIRDVIPWR